MSFASSQTSTDEQKRNKDKGLEKQGEEEGLTLNKICREQLNDEHMWRMDSEEDETIRDESRGRAHMRLRTPEERRKREEERRKLEKEQMQLRRTSNEALDFDDYLINDDDHNPR
jgi:hypothetical protein